MTTRTFSLADQLEFAQLSGDYNPLHVDPVAARRSMFGGVVVHGIHSLLWALDIWSRDRPLPVGISSIHANFTRSIRLGDVVTCSLMTERAGQAQLHLLVDGSVSTKVKINWQPSQLESLNLFTAGFPQRQEPRVLAMHDADNASGTVPLYLDPECVARLFPHLLGAASPLQLAQLLATTRLVGMECPGLYSFYSSVEVHFRTDEDTTPVLSYNVTKLDTRYGVVIMSITSPNVTGTVTAFFRPPPYNQIGYAAIQDIVGCREFAGQRALVIGGSRGLGEVTAKLLAAGGADVKLTYHQGAADARRVVAEITSTGGRAGCVPFDVLDHTSRIDDILDHEWTPTHLYYLASPFISRGRKGGFSGPLFQTFCNYYVLGFSRLFQHLCLRGLTRVFYPSTVFVDELPADMSEYAAAKIAGEELCQFLEKAYPAIILQKPRLPRMATDQTVSFVPGENRDPVPVLLEHLRNMANENVVC
ncbi:MAG: SDR family NAD(P)-dependent oxidoreductase [Thermoguttaceae bacterium]|jgi:hypothetical protein